MGGDMKLDLCPPKYYLSDHRRRSKEYRAVAAINNKFLDLAGNVNYHRDFSDSKNWSDEMFDLYDSLIRARMVFLEAGLYNHYINSEEN